MQQDDENKKMKSLSKALNKIKKLEDSLKEKDSLLRSAEGSLAEAHSQNEKLSKELEEARTILEKNSDRFNRESKALNARIEAEIEKKVKLSETVTNLRDKCFGFAT
jgi:predicted nuclease with TOPRIM domain